MTTVLLFRCWQVADKLLSTTVMALSQNKKREINALLRLEKMSCAKFEAATLDQVAALIADQEAG